MEEELRKTSIFYAKKKCFEWCIAEFCHFALDTFPPELMTFTSVHCINHCTSAFIKKKKKQLANWNTYKLFKYFFNLKK